MSSIAPVKQPYYLGIDGGGSKCQVVLTDASATVLGKGLGGPANPLRGMELTTQSILDATYQALEQAALPASVIGSLTVGAGLAGVNIPKYHQLFSTWQHPFAALHLTSDLHAACIGAHQGRDGAVIICGTGSCGLAAVKGQVLEVGGHGFPYGDSGSGAWFGLQLLQRVLRSKDGLLAPTRMTELLQQALGITDTVALATHFMHASATEYARLAPLVFDAAEQQDVQALQIIAEGASHVNAIAKRLLVLEPPAITLIGGLAPKLIPYLDTHIRALLVPACQPPEFGAIWFAKTADQRAGSSTVINSHAGISPYILET
ncbi:N-acetylglucosamine kinase [Alishewanella tabrizica]|uniref:ATPase n=1 Tax=Alishewanella tabrizica TaxID=671278 RepID=A0ABQ2WMD7_9ALTE|nr:BadF/BadG/BcrA/BcrD ATPase family protein [Alishewanella tabrizica]GGW62894.1 ATPase [Alishewanella tabrizica]